MRIAKKFYKTERTKYRKLFLAQLTKSQVVGLIRRLRNKFCVVGAVIAVWDSEDTITKPELENNEAAWDWNGKCHVIRFGNFPSAGIVAHEMAHAVAFERTLGNHSGHYGAYTSAHKQIMEFAKSILL